MFIVFPFKTFHIDILSTSTQRNDSLEEIQDRQFGQEFHSLHYQ